MIGHGAIVHEWLEPTGGAEKVVDRLALNFAEAPIYTLWNDAPGRFPPNRVRESWLAKSPLRGHKALCLPLMPAIWRNLDGSADWVLCSSHLFSHHAKLSGGSRGSSAPKLVYAYTPARYIWEPEVDGRGSSIPVRLASRVLRPIDRRRAGEARSIAAISKYVQERILQTWGRHSEVIYPPVAVRDFVNAKPELNSTELELVTGLPNDYLLGASRFVPYKRLDDVIRAGEVCGLPVVIAGGGPDERRLRDIASTARVPVIFVARPSQGLLISLYQKANAFVFPAVEDFGIMPVEAMATGTPVIGLNSGGVSETVVHGESGMLVDSFRSSAELRSAVEGITTLSTANIVKRAWRFDEINFDSAIKSWVEESVGSTTDRSR